MLHGFATIGGVGAAYAAMNALGLLGHGRALAAGDTTQPLPTGSLTGRRVVVIGAGLAGLCSALRLARAGAEVEILEATGRAGGRSMTLRHGDSYSEWDWNSPTTMTFEQVGDVPPDDPGNYLNAGPGRIPQHHARVIDYCKLLGVELRPFIYTDAANLMQNDVWNGGRPVQLRRQKNDLRGHLAEILAKVSDQGALDRLVSPDDMEAILGLLTQFGQLTGDGAQMFYAGAALSSDYPRAGYRIQPGDVTQPGVAWPTLTLDEVLASDFWQSEMFHDLEYFWQATLMEPVGGMDMIVKGFLRADLPGGRTVRDLIVTGEPVRSIDVAGDEVHHRDRRRSASASRLRRRHPVGTAAGTAWREFPRRRGSSDTVQRLYRPGLQGRLAGSVTVLGGRGPHLWRHLVDQGHHQPDLVPVLRLQQLDGGPHRCLQPRRAGPRIPGTDPRSSPQGGSGRRRKAPSRFPRQGLCRQRRDYRVDQNALSGWRLGR